MATIRDVGVFAGLQAIGRAIQEASVYTPVLSPRVIRLGAGAALLGLAVSGRVSGGAELACLVAGSKLVVDEIAEIIKERIATPAPAPAPAPAPTGAAAPRTAARII